MSGGDRQCCARHPEEIAELACDRCGDFVCAECLGSETAFVCSLCREQTKEDRVAWERADASLFRRYLRTARSCLLQPDETGALIAHGGELRRALAYLATVPVVLGLAVWAFSTLAAVFAATLAPAGAPTAPASQLAIGTVMLLLLVPSSLLVLCAVHAGFTTASFYLTARILGGRGDLATSARATAYFSGLALWMIPGIAASMTPFVGIIVLVGVPVWLLVCFVIGMRSVARHAHGLTDARALAAALAPVAMYATLLCIAAAAVWAR